MIILWILLVAVIVWITGWITYKHVFTKKTLEHEDLLCMIIDLQAYLLGEDESPANDYASPLDYLSELHRQACIRDDNDYYLCIDDVTKDDYNNHRKDY